MSLEAYKHDMQRCTRCSYCKFIPYETYRNADFITGCPSVSKYNFHAYSAGGKFNMALSFLAGRIQPSDTFLDALYRCQMDGSCDVSCKAIQDIEPLQLMQELRIRCVEDGRTIPSHNAVIEGLRKEDNMMQASRMDRGQWAEGLGAKDLTKEQAKVLFFAGCQYSFNRELWPVARSGLSLLKNAGVDIGIMGKAEMCCGGRAYEIGYAGELNKYAERQGKVWKAAGIDTVVTPCAHCYQTLKVLYDKIGKKPEIEILHITEYLDRLMKEGKIKAKKRVPLKVTYHDPCHLGRLAEPWVHWNGKEKKVLGQLIVHDPPKKFRRGAGGVYDIPRNIIKSVPGLKFEEMYRIRAYAWCCGAGGGVKEAYPDFAVWTAKERIREAKAVGAEAIISACPTCKQNFLDALKETGENLKVMDVVELLQESI
jgi:Fe-S oxidoreductase